MSGVYFGFALPSEIIPTRIVKFVSKLPNVVETYWASLCDFLLLLS